MPLGLQIAAVLLHTGCTVLFLYWAIGLGRLISTVRRHPTARSGLKMGLPEAPPSVCIVIPAHNEAGMIGPLIASLRAQDYPNFRVVFSLDRCTDSTDAVVQAAIAQDTRFEIVRTLECPEGWAGKVHAVWRGVREARDEMARNAEILIFADADTTFDPSCVRATVALMLDRKLDLLSLLSTLTTTHWFEWLVQPAATLETVTQYPLIRASRATGRRAFANGQFMMFRREAYEAVGGHESVRGELLEDLALARRMSIAARPAGVFLADGILRCSMYANWREFTRGWGRIYIELASRSPGRLVRSAARVLGFGVLLPLAALSNVVGGLWTTALSVGGAPGWSDALPWGIAGIAIGLAAFVPLMIMLACGYRLGRAPMWAVPGYFVGASIVAGLLLRAAKDLRAGRAVEWAGRSYVRPVE